MFQIPLQRFVGNIFTCQDSLPCH